jgi:hypothetical protein
MFLIRFFFRLVFGAVKSLVTLALVAALGVAYLDFRYAETKLPEVQGVSYRTGLCRTTPSVSGGALPLTFEAFAKSHAKHNYLASGTTAGLVSARYEWSLGGFSWVEDKGFVERQQDAAKQRAKLAAADVPTLLKDLRSDDIVVREVAAKELYLRTGTTQGYAYDAARADRDEAAAAYEKWWADDHNRALVKGRAVAGAGASVIDGAEKALETLRQYEKGSEKK